MHILNRRFVSQYALALVLFLTADSFWIYFVASHLYQDQVSSILAAHPGWPPVLVFYVLYTFGLWVLAIKPSHKASHAGLRGGILGLTAYGTYALTGQALFHGWSWVLTSSDLAWGGFISALVAFLVVKFLPE